MDYRKAFEAALPNKATVLEHLDPSFNWNTVRLDERFNGIDAERTLSNYSPVALKNILFKLETLLKPEGVLYMQFPYGKGTGCYNLGSIATAVSKPLLFEFHLTGIDENGIFHVLLKKGERKSKL